MASIAVFGFDTDARGWVADADRRPAVHEVPSLDGTLRLDQAIRIANARDQGNIVRGRPGAVLEPRSVRDIQQMVRFCRQHRIPVAMRGQGHSTYGQSLTAGLVVDSRTLNRIHVIADDHAVVDAGVLWQDLVFAAFQVRLGPPVLAYLGLSVGGTLSMGGVGATNTEGLQADRVRALEVVTGAGEVVRCSMSEHRDLFEAVLGGVGQCGIITKATVDLVPVKSMVRTYTLPYNDTASFVRDLRTLLGRGELECVYNVSGLQGSSLSYGLTAHTFFEPPNPPDNAHLLRDLSLPPGTAMVTDSGYLDWALRVDVLVAFLRAMVSWDELIKPWFDVWLPDSALEGYLGDVFPALTPADVGPAGSVLLYPQRRSTLTRPMCRVPDAAPDDWVYLFDILTTSTTPGPEPATPGPEPAFTRRMLARNRRLFEQARAVGGTRYLISSVEFDREDWVQHYGTLWPGFVRLKQRYDPDAILSTGLGIF